MDWMDAVQPRNRKPFVGNRRLVSVIVCAKCGAYEIRNKGARDSQSEFERFECRCCGHKWVEKRGKGKRQRAYLAE